MKHYTSMIILLLSLAALAGCRETRVRPVEAHPAGGDDAVQVQVSRVEAAQRTRTLSYSGSVAPVMTTPLSFAQVGTVKTVAVEEGDRVKKGQLLARLDNATARGAFRAATAMERQAQDAHDRLKSVYEKGSLPAIKWEEVISKLEQAKSSKGMAAGSLADCTLKAPVSGLVGRRNVEVGSNASPNVPVLEIIDIDDVYVRVAVPENEISLIEKGLAAQVTVPALGDRAFSGTVEKVGVSADLVSKTYEVKLLLDNEDGALRPGMVAAVEMTVSSDGPQITVPVEAVDRDSTGAAFVYVLGDEDLAHARPVEIGLFEGNRVGIRGGLEPGEIIVTNGIHDLSDGARVAYEAPAGSSTAAR